MTIEHAQNEIIVCLKKINVYQKAIASAYEGQKTEYMKIFSISDKVPRKYLKQLRHLYAEFQINNPVEDAQL